MLFPFTLVPPKPAPRQTTGSLKNPAEDLFENPFKTDPFGAPSLNSVSILNPSCLAGIVSCVLYQQCARSSRTRSQCETFIPTECRHNYQRLLIGYI